MRTRRPGLRHQGGFTLVETVITIVVVGIAFVVLLSFTQSLRSSANRSSSNRPSPCRRRGSIRSSRIGATRRRPGGLATPPIRPIIRRRRR